MSAKNLRRLARAILIGGAGGLAMATGAAAKDLPATPAGAAALAGTFKTYFGAAGANVTVAIDGDSYAVSYDLAAVLNPLYNGVATFDAAKMSLKLFAQDDGSWRVERYQVPNITWRDKVGGVARDNTISYFGLKSAIVYDPAIAGPRHGDFSIDKVTYASHRPNGDNNFEVSGLKGQVDGKGGADGVYAAKGHETFDTLGFNFPLDPHVAEPNKITDAKPTTIFGKGGVGAIDIAIDGWKTKALLDVWAFAVANPSRPQLAANAPAFKALLQPIAASQPSINESVQAGALQINAPQGMISLDKAAFGFTLAAQGPQSRFEETIAVSGLKLPDGLAPSQYHDLIPSDVALDIKVSGFDVNAAAQEAIADMQLQGDGPVISKDDNDKVLAKLVSAGTVNVEITPSHVTAPKVNLTVEGKMQYRPGGKPTGAFTIHMRNFDQTVAALKSVGPDAEQKLIPVLAMAKGLAKTESDGALAWVGELGADGVLKINGLPLGKPFGK